MVGDTAAAGTELRTRARAADRRHVRRMADPRAVARADRRSLRRWRHGNPFDRRHALIYWGVSYIRRVPIKAAPAGMRHGLKGRNYA